MKYITVFGHSTHLYHIAECIHAHREFDDLFAVGIWRVLHRDYMFRLDLHFIDVQEKFAFTAA